jgi:hypothetical protein
LHKYIFNNFDQQGIVEDSGGSLIFFLSGASNTMRGMKQGQDEEGTTRRIQRVTGLNHKAPLEELTWETFV